jgi:tetratricopeptide (TPR) repeat protein
LVQLFLGLLFLPFVWAQGPAKTQAEISIQNDTVHLELSGLPQWKYQINRQQNKITMEVESLHESASAGLQNFRSPVVKSVIVKKGVPSGRDTIEFQLASSKIDFFDYLTDEPSRLIVDFYPSPEETKANPVAAKPNSASMKARDKKREPASDAVVVGPKGPVAGDPARVNHGLFDGADPKFERFMINDYEIKEESIIQSRDRFYIRFPWLFESPRKWKDVLSSENIYQVQPKSEEENKQMRLLEKLFNRNRNLVFLQTANWFLDKYPKSEFKEMVSYMKAETRDKIYQESKKPEDFNLAILSFRSALDEFPNSTLAEKVSLQLGIKLYENKDYLASLRAFNQHLESNQIKTKSELSKDLARLGIALSYMHLRKFDESVQQLIELKSKSQNPEIQHEATYRMGDIFVQSKKYPESIKKYSAAQKEFPMSQNQFPNSFFNKAEAQFWLGNYKQALSDFRDYIIRFPSDAHAPLALTRIGEVLEILGADKSRVMGAYLEAYFRYGESPNAGVARIRMIAARIKTMKPKEVELAAKEILDLSKKMSFEDVDKLATILISEGYNARAEFDKTLDMLISYYQLNPLMTQREQFSKRVVSTINQKIADLVESKDFLGALRTHQKYSDVWLKKSDRLDTRYFLGSSFEQAGVPAEAEKYYREVLNRLLSYKGTNREKEIRVVQQLPSTEVIYLKLAKTFYSQKKFQESYETLKQIKESNSLSENDQIERVSLSVNLLMEKEDYDSAKRFVLELLRNWKGEPGKMSQPYLRLAEIEVRTGQYDQAFASLKKVDELYEDTKSAPNETHFKSLEKRFELALKLNRQEEAIIAAEKILKSYEDTKPVASIRYRWGQILASQGKLKKAEEVWASFKGTQSDFWKNLATEKVNSEAWNEDYKKYRNRIPAMSSEGTN